METKKRTTQAEIQVQQMYMEKLTTQAEVRV